MSPRHFDKQDFWSAVASVHSIDRRPQPAHWAKWEGRKVYEDPDVAAKRVGQVLYLIGLGIIAAVGIAMKMFS